MNSDQVRRCSRRRPKVDSPSSASCCSNSNSRVTTALVRSIFREIHTLKGSSAVAGLDDVSRIAHDLEELVDDLRAGERPVTADVIDTLLRGVDRLSAAINRRRAVNMSRSHRSSAGNDTSRARARWLALSPMPAMPSRCPQGRMPSTTPPANPGRPKAAEPR